MRCLRSIVPAAQDAGDAGRRPPALASAHPVGDQELGDRVLAPPVLDALAEDPAVGGDFGGILRPTVARLHVAVRRSAPRLALRDGAAVDPRLRPRLDLLALELGELGEDAGLQPAFRRRAVELLPGGHDCHPGGIDDA
jgi:hypothetical protein